MSSVRQKRYDDMLNRGLRPPDPLTRSLAWAPGPARARFSEYVFLSCEILRAVRIHSLTLGLIALGFLVYLQLPASRRYHPSVDPQRVLARLRLKRKG